MVAQDSVSRHNSSILNQKYRYQLLAGVTVQLLTFAHGIGNGWVAPSLHKLQSLNSPTNFTISVEEVSWIGSLYGLGSLAGNILFGLLINQIGRKWCMYLMALPYMSAWILIYFSRTYIYLYVARFLSGMTGGGVFVVLPIFISEIADPSIRGALSSMGMLYLGFGSLLGFVFSSHLDYYLNPFIIIIFPIIYLIAAIKLPETPQYLLKKQQIDKAWEAFKFYKNSSKNKFIEATTSTNDEETAEFEELKKNILQNNGQSEKLKVQDFVNPEALKAFSAALMFIMVNQLSGTFCFFNYMSDIFAQTGTDINPNTCTIIMGVAQIVGTCFTVLLVDRFGRKSFMLMSSAGMTVGSLGFAVYIQFTTSEQKLQYNWLPLIIMAFITLIANIGVVALVFTLVVEVLPNKIRAAGTSISMAIYSCMMFITLKVFPVLLQDYGLTTVFYLCGGVSVIGWVYFLICLKETKGKSLDK